MPTVRTRVTRTTKLAADALQWVKSPDARRFFSARTSDDYAAEGTPPVYLLSQARPWWDDLHDVWLAHRAGLPVDDSEALAFLVALHEAYRK